MKQASNRDMKMLEDDKQRRVEELRKTEKLALGLNTERESFCVHFV